ncbi:glutathione S-transferase C-terminal domain-containing protein [Photobacterium aphoticum]|uniref:Glutathione S-transferase n=1 Tax=Photobacterium aphoticum TaxID=754436 RepID=A0A0J1GL33_9GAMM|nr:glutathione S-transferase C-terminal domain-containing protein [Photobacterium aphoticum]KLV00413.1 glutathione S-transferase [Photobacterium aphoticum]PSU59754.1 glutathione-dependent reductase [Photobacterium aphoticum]GHA42607.1 glutathione-dependent reductase [Photobacterium aphoticum]
MAVLEQGIWYPNKNANELDHEDQFALPETVVAGRYHLYMSLACPFAHRPYLVINYLGLDEAISVSSVAAKRYNYGWEFDTEHADPIYGRPKLADLYLKAKPDYTGVVSVPVLWDKETQQIVGNDSAAMAMDLATRWLPLAKHPVELVPAAQREAIETLNTWLHVNVNRKVYQVGFATDQATYDEASESLFAALETLDARLSQSKYLFGEQVTLSDLFLLPTLVRFEVVYEVHFKANKKPLRAFTHLYRYMRELVADPRIRSTLDIEYMKQHYYFSHKHINPYGIVPAGPQLDWL